jgi:DNA polymerase I-like protein with 3'-5' exonuclease and polymerase domains
MTTIPDMKPFSWVGVDFETYYDKECSVKTYGAYGYTHHENYDPYMVSIVADTFEWCGHPKDAPWEDIDGLPWVSHNATFDWHVYMQLQETYPHLQDIGPIIWEDSAGLAAYLRFPRALGHLIPVVYKTRLNKGVRDGMEGKKFEDLDKADQDEVTEYALEDSRWMMRFWHDYIDQWPVEERLLSNYTMRLSGTALPIDKSAIEKAIYDLNEYKRAEAAKLPWVDDPDTDVVASPSKLAEELKKIGLKPPVTTAADDPVFQKWIRQHPEAAHLTTPMQEWRSLNRAHRLFQAMGRRIRPDGRMMHELKYAGAHTLRWSGAAGLNVQNQSRDIIRGIDIRGAIRAPKGRKLVIADYSQIEPRCMAWILKDKTALAQMAAGMSPYEVHARATMGYTDPERLKDEDARKYALAKARVLALGYGAGAGKFVAMASNYISREDFVAIFHKEPTKEDATALHEFLKWKGIEHVIEFNSLSRQEQVEQINAYKVVRDFRNTNPELAGTEKSCGKDGLWTRLHKTLSGSIGDTCEIVMPNGYTIEYFDVQKETARGKGFGILSRFYRGGPLRATYGGLMTENMIQCIARFVFAHGLLKLHQAGFDVLFHVHDELVVEVDEDVKVEDVTQYMLECPSWIAGLPLAVEAVESDRYLK